MPVEASLSTEEQDFLRALSRVVVLIPRAFDSDLGREVEMSSSEFFTLMHLSEAPGGRLRMGELAAATALTLGRVTQVVTRLEAEGLVERRPCATDRRGHDTLLTAAGAERLAGARSHQIASVRRRIFDRLDGLDGLDLAACTEVLSRIGTDAPTPSPQTGRA
jgi:DNA-binding MarR family transcriptional regulator